MPDLILTAADVGIVAAEGAKLPRVSILAYTGDVMTVPGFGPIVLDLKGMDFGSEIPLLADHANAIGSIVGQGSPSVRAGQLHVDGKCNMTTEAAKTIVDLAKSGHKFQASVGATPLESRRIDAGKSVHVNGRTIKATSSFLLVTKSQLREVTICALGCDAGTSVSIAAKKGKTMPAIAPTLRDFITELGGNPDNMTEQQLLSAQANFEGREYHPPINASLDGEAERIEAINAIEARAELAMHNPQHETLVAELKQRGIQSGWTRNKVELEIIRASRAQGITAHSGGNAGTGPQHLSASLMVKAGYSTAAEKIFGERVMEQSKRLHHQSLPDLCRAALMIDGRPIPHTRDELIRASLSTGSMPVALGDSANKVLMVAYQQAPAAWRSFAAVKPAANFKTQTGIRPTWGGDLTQLAPAVQSRTARLRKRPTPGASIHSRSNSKSTADKSSTTTRAFSATSSPAWLVRRCGRSTSWSRPRCWPMAAVSSAQET